MAVANRVAQAAVGPQLGQGLARHDPGGELGQWHAAGLGHERHRPAGPGVRLDHEDLPGLDRVLDVDQAAHLELVGDGPGVGLEHGECLGREGDRGQHAGGVAGVHAGLLDVLHDPADHEPALGVA